MSQKKTPVIRFKGFSEDWVQRRLGEVVQIIMGQSPSSENYTDNSEDYILVQGNADIKNSHVVPRVWTTQVTKQAEKGDLILSVRAPVGDIGKTDFDVVIGRGVAAIKGNEFIFQQFRKMKISNYWARYSTGSTFESINSNDINNALILIPKLKEQQKVGNFLKKLDDIIALHQRKLESLKSLKKGYLQQMFPQKGEKTPRLRFANFEGYWVQRKLGDVADIIGGGTPSTNVPEYWGGNIDWYSPVEIGDRIYVNSSLKKITDLGLQKSSAHKLPVGTVLFTSRAGIGNTAILLKEGCTNQGFQSIVPHKNRLDSYFIFSRTHELKRFGETNGAGSTFVEISGKQMSRMPITLPSTDEQQKIGNFFKQLDGLITLHQRKLELLKSLKKGYLQQMFPQKDEKTPRLRFANFEGYWVQRKLGDVADIIGGGTPSTNVPEYWGGNIDWYSPVEIGDRIYVNSSLKKITDLGLQKSSAHKLPIGTVLFTSRAGIGNTAILLKEGCTNQGFQSIVPHKNRLDSYFIFSRTHELKRFGETNGAGSTFVEISGKQMSRMPITLPSTDEQQKIGNFFKQLDGLITLHQNKTTQLQSIKKAYLQNMFI